MQLWTRYWHCFGVTEDGIFAWGANDNGQLGSGKSKSRELHPIQITCLGEHKIRKISCGWDHSMALTTEGLVFTWGGGGKGQLGMGRYDDIPQYIPQEVKSPDGQKWYDIFTGKHSSYG